MTELIVALDGNADEIAIVFRRIHRERLTTWFKVGPQLLLQHSGMILVENMLHEGEANLFVDAKLYDTRDTVYETARLAFVEVGARFLSVHATPSMLEAAMRAKPAGDRCKVLAVGPLTDGANPIWQARLSLAEMPCDGFICPSVGHLALWRDILRREDRTGILVCPGIRPAIWPNDDNHTDPATPAEAKAAGADYIVVGRPIYSAPDPVAAARAIVEELR